MIFLDFIQAFPTAKYDFKTLVSIHPGFVIFKNERIGWSMLGQI
jgi:hypothetical protein